MLISGVWLYGALLLRERLAGRIIILLGALLSLLLPVQRASEECGWLKAMVDAGEIYHPLRLSPSEALQLLNDMPLLESAGVIVRDRPGRGLVRASVGWWTSDDDLDRLLAGLAG